MIKTTLALLLFLVAPLTSAAMPAVVVELQEDLKASMSAYPVKDPANLCFQRSVEAWEVAGFHIEMLATTTPGIGRRNMHIKQARVWLAVGSLYASLNRDGHREACEQGPFSEVSQ